MMVENILSVTHYQLVFMDDINRQTID